MRLPGALIELLRPGEGEMSGAAMWRIGSVVLATVNVMTNLVGTAVVLVLAIWVVPDPHIQHQSHVEPVNALVAAAYVAFLVPLGIGIGDRRRWRLRGRHGGGRHRTLARL